MASNETADGIAALESQAETVLAQARDRAAEILRAANREASGVLAEPLPLERVRAEYATIVEAARAEAGTALEQAKKEAGRVRSRLAAGVTALQDLAKGIEGTVRGER